MRALTRIKTLAAASMLLLFIATNVLANVPSRPVDRPEGPPEHVPTEVGEPDGGSGGLPMYVRQLMLAASLSNSLIRRFAFPVLKRPTPTPIELRQRLRAGSSR